MRDYGQTYIPQSGALLLRPEPAKWCTIAPAHWRSFAPALTDLDLLKKPDGSFAALEINPRFSGTLVFALKVGVDLPACYFSDDTAKYTPITGAIPSANRFRSVLQHADFRMKNGELTAYEPANQICADSRFPDDTGYSLALEKKLRWIRLLTQFSDLARLIRRPFAGRAKEVTKA